MKRTKKSLAVALAFMMLVPTVGVWADELEDRLDSVKSQMESEQANIDWAKAQIENITEYLSQLQQEAETVQAELTKIKTELTETEKNIAENEVVLADAEKRLDAHTKVLHKRLRDIYINGKINYLDVLFGAKDFNDLVTRMDLLKRIASQDAALVSQVRNERALIVEKRQQLEADKARLVVLKQDAETNQKRIEANRSEQQSMLAQAQEDQAAAERAYRELLAKSNEIEEMLRNRPSSPSTPSYVQGSGDLIWPLTSMMITSEYGWRVHPIFGTSRYHSGIDIGADYGDSIWAAAGGVVIHSGWLGGYGKTVIIDHGGGLTSLYAHNSELMVSEGESVYQGQVIAYAGSTGYSTGPHLHFEVREYGEPVSPYNYL